MLRPAQMLGITDGIVDGHLRQTRCFVDDFLQELQQMQHARLGRQAAPLR
jgi:hypothetical protein